MNNHMINQKRLHLKRYASHTIMRIPGNLASAKPHTVIAGWLSLDEMLFISDIYIYPIHKMIRFLVIYNAIDEMDSIL